MITIGILAAWFMLSTMFFMMFTFISWLEKSMDNQRSVNTAVVLFSQAVAASFITLVIYAIY